MKLKVLFLSVASALFLVQSHAVLANHGDKHPKHISVKEADADNDGTLTLEEFTAVHEEDAEKCFSKMDKDNDGTLDQKEINSSKYHGKRAKARK